MGLEVAAGAVPERAVTEPSKSLWRAAAIITLVAPLVGFGAWLYGIFAGIQSDDLTTLGKLSFGFLVGTLATRAWGD